MAAAERPLTATNVTNQIHRFPTPRFAVLSLEKNWELKKVWSKRLAA